MTRIQKRLLLSAAVALALAAALSIHGPDLARSDLSDSDAAAPSPRGSHSADLPSVPVRTVVPAWPGPYSAPVGRCFDMRARLANSCVLAEREGDGQLHSLSFVAEGVLGVTVLARRGRELIFALDWRDLVVRASTGSEPMSGDSLRADLVQRVLVRAECTGEVLGVALPRTVSASGRNSWRALVAAIRFVVVEDGASTWATEEADPTGIASVAYVRTPATAAGSEVRRTCTSYRAAQPLAQTSVQGVANFAGDAGWYVSAQHRAELIIELVEMRTRIEASQSVDLEVQQVRDQAADASASVDWDQAWSDLRGVDDVNRAGDELARRRRALQADHATVAGVVAALAEALRADGGDGEAAIEQRRLLIELLRAQPEATHHLAVVLAQPDLPPATVGFLLSAAGAAGTAPAQQVCAEFALAATRPAGARMAALHALFQTDAPTERTLEAVFSIASDIAAPLPVAGTALLLLGAYANGNAAVRAQDLIEFEQYATERGMLNDWLAALGNAGGDAVVDAVWPHLAAVDPEVRVAALRALRRVPHPRAEQALLAGLDVDADPRVRRAAAKQLAERASDPALAALERLLPDADRGLRDAIRRGLQGAEGPRARALLRSLGG